MWRLVGDLLERRALDLRAEGTEHEDRELLIAALVLLTLAEVIRDALKAMRDREAA